MGCPAGIAAFRIERFRRQRFAKYKQVQAFEKETVIFRSRKWFSCALVIIVVMNLSGCATISGRETQAKKAGRENKANDPVKSVKDFAGK